MSSDWVFTVMGSTVFIGCVAETIVLTLCLGILTLIHFRLAVTLLQVDVVSNQIYLRMTSFIVFALSLSSGFSACIFQVSKGKLSSDIKAIMWVQASMDYANLESREFWSVIAFP